MRVWPKGTVAVQSWLDQQGIDRKLMDSYRQHGWVERIAPGAYKHIDDEVSWQGAVYTLQFQLGMSGHLAGTSALNISGLGHYLPLGHGTTQWLFVDANEKRKTPKWFRNLFCSKFNVEIVHTNLFKNHIASSLAEVEVNNFKLTASSPERALFECLYLTPDKISFEHVSQLIENSRTLRPEVVTELLNHCQSIKVKRLFLYLADLHQHNWMSRINTQGIDLGNGARKIGNGGHYVSKYRLSVPYLNEHEGYQDDEQGESS